MTALAPSVRTLLGCSAVLLASSVAAAQARVALCAAASGSLTACQWTDVQTRLSATTQFATVDLVHVGTGTPTLAQLLAYDALLCWTNSAPQDNNAWGDVLADYVDAGGGVVVAVFANSINSATLHIGGRWQSGYEVILDRTGTTTGASGLGQVLQPTHPIMAGVTAFTSGPTGGRPTGTALEVGATAIALWQDGKILVAEGANPKRVDLGFYPPNASCNAYGWATGGDVLMTNALLHVAGGGSYTTFGTGCAGTAGTPTLALTSGSRPVLGNTLSVTVGNLPLGVGFVSMGFSNAMQPPFALPLDLGQFGMPGCRLLAEVAAAQLVAGAGTNANWTLPLPANPAFVGTVFFNQAFAIDPTANAAGLTTSNGGRATLGP